MTVTTARHASLYLLFPVIVSTTTAIRLLLGLLVIQYMLIRNLR